MENVMSNPLSAPQKGTMQQPKSQGMAPPTQKAPSKPMTQQEKLKMMLDMDAKFEPINLTKSVLLIKLTIANIQSQLKLTLPPPVIKYFNNKLEAVYENRQCLAQLYEDKKLNSKIYLDLIKKMFNEHNILFNECKQKGLKQTIPKYFRLFNQI